MPTRGSAPGIVLTHIVRPEGAENSPAPLQGAQQLIDSVTQGVALGWHAAALSAPNCLTGNCPYLFLQMNFWGAQFDHE